MRVLVRATRRPVHRGFMAGTLAIGLMLGGCGGTPVTPPSAPSTSAPATSGTSSTSLAELAAKVTASGIDCSGAHHTGDDPGATDQVTCGGLEHTIDIETFDSHDVMAAQFLPYLRDFFCHASPDTIYLDGGTWAIYSTKDADITQIATAFGVQPTKLCA